MAYITKRGSSYSVRYTLMGPEKQFSGLVGNQFIPDIIFILKIEVKRPLGNPGLIYNI